VHERYGADQAQTLLAGYTRQRDNLLARIVGVLDADVRVRSAWLSGSFGRGEADAWSDFDLHVAVEDEELVGFWAARHELYAQMGRPVLIQPEMQSNAQPGAHFQLVVFDGPLEVDWNIGPLSQARRPATSHILVQRADVPLMVQSSLTSTERLASLDHQLTFFWAMAPIAVKYIARAQTRRAVGQLGHLTGALLSLWRLLADANAPDPGLGSTNRALEPEFAQRLPTLGERIDPLGCLAVLRAQCAEVEQLHAALQALDVAIPGGDAGAGAPSGTSGGGRAAEPPTSFLMRCAQPTTRRLVQRW
jgi:predicted nucleotidyltransferase